MKNKFMRWIVLSIASICAPLCASCNGPKDNGKMKIVTTIFPEYDWVMNIVGEQKDNIDVTMLLDSGVDLHSYSPTPLDIVTISNCDLFIYVGGESDGWTEEVLKTAKNKDMKVINLMTVLGEGAKEEEIIEGMEGEEEEEEEEEEETEYDEHVWLSLKNAELFINSICDSIVSLDQENASYYTSNAVSYITSLKALDARYSAVVSKSAKNTLLFADRFPFRYLVEDYSLKYYAAFIGCSAATAASFETIKFLAGKVDELGLKVILKIEDSDGRIADAVKNATQDKDQKILVMDSIQSATTKEYENGRNYLSIMEKNLEVLTEALR